MNTILSVGIDVGTTSTHLTFSELRLANTSKVNEPTRLVVAERKIIYQSPIHFTPLTDEGIIDARSVVELIRGEYARAGISPNGIATGAVIITGETAKKRNAEAIVTELADLAGTFVSASAGPHLESAFAARGSGACEASRNGKVICNVDIGGGTTNIAFCDNGKVRDTRWLAIGGRVCAAVPAECARAAAAILESVNASPFDQIWFSGGVAEVMRQLLNGDPIPDDAFGDAGVLLARALLGSLSAVSFHIPDAPIRATVIGAGSYSLQLSGSTVCVREDVLPLKNLPIVALESVHKENWSQPLALMMPPLPPMGYGELKDYAQKLAMTFRKSKVHPPFILLMQQDMAAALGQLLANELPEVDRIVLDGIGSDCGDFIDIGKPMANGQFVPVVIKELLFASHSAAAAAEA